ncbi:MAG: hypothetical protein GY795_00960 [Desulfobacterales bacterium]|nr:hypothetical protein [Desulfobacterales bacterium]
MDNIIEKTKKHWFIGVIIIGVACISTTLFLANELLVKPRDFALNEREKKIADKEKELSELKLRIEKLSKEYKDCVSKSDKNKRLIPIQPNQSKLSNKQNETTGVSTASICKINIIEPTKKNVSIYNDKNKLSLYGNIELGVPGSIFNYLKENNLVLIPVIENGEHFTYDIIHVNADGTFRDSWPISSVYINGHTFWIGLFEKGGLIQPRQQYNSSPAEYAKFISHFIYFE